MDTVIVRKTSLAGVLAITPPTVFEDFRGSYVETYNLAAYRAAGIEIEFLQDGVSTSTRHVLRGIHGNRNTWKLVSCLHGRIYLVIVNCDPDSAGFGKWEAFTCSGTNGLQVLVPPNHGTAHLVLSEVALFNYKQSTYYDRDSQFTYRFDDPRFAIYWPVREPILSARDRLL